MEATLNVTTIPAELLAESEDEVQLYNYQSTLPQLKNKIHLSQNIISFLLEGTKEVIGDYKSTKIDNRQFLILKSGNCLMTENLSEADQRYRSILMFFSDEMLLKFLRKNKDAATPTEASKPFVVCTYDPYIQQYVHSLDRLFQLDKTLQQRLLQVKFEEIMTYLSQQHGPGFLTSLLENQNDKTRHFMQVVESNKHNKLTLQELSFLCNMSLSTFKREFRKHYHTTPIKWFQENRLDHAAFLLRTQQKRPIELYEEVGYENLSNFIQAFKKRFGTTPKQFQLAN